jgi:microcystin-dependent protein
MSDYFVGEIRMFAGTFAPQDWHLCDGAVLPINTYQTLYALLGTTWGGDGRTTFGIPDLRGRVPLGQGTGTGLTARTLGQTGGTESEALADVKYLLNHNHAIAVTSTVADQIAPATTVNLAQTKSPSTNYLPDAKVPSPPLARVMDTNAVGPAGSGLSHSNMMQSFAVTFIICVNGLFPQRQS